MTEKKYIVTKSQLRRVTKVEALKIDREMLEYALNANIKNLDNAIKQLPPKYKGTHEFVNVLTSLKGLLQNI